jgi:hypothetical protein
VNNTKKVNIKVHMFAFDKVRKSSKVVLKIFDDHCPEYISYRAALAVQLDSLAKSSRSHAELLLSAALLNLGHTLVL